MANFEMNAHVILYRAHKINDTVRREVKILKEQLPDCDVVIVGYTAQKQDVSGLPSGVEFISYDRVALETLDYPVKLSHVNWDSTTGHNDLPIFRFFRDRPEYKYYWIIEYDVRYTGNWSILFGDLNLSNADLLGTNVMDFDEFAVLGVVEQERTSAHHFADGKPVENLCSFHEAFQEAASRG